MRRLSLLIMFFFIAFAVFIMGPPFLGYTFGPYPLIKISDIFDLFTPLILIPLYWMLFRINGSGDTGIKESLLFMVFTAFWVLGKGMQLTANSIGHLTIASSDVHNLIYFYDEVLGHYLWHIGVIGLSALLIYRQWKTPLTEIISLAWNNILAGIIYGFTFFAMVVEGQTTLMGVPFAVLVVICCSILWRNKINRQPILSFFLIGYLVAVILFAIWGIWQRGLPEFTEVGII